jgi:hypothetical protein
MAIAALLEQAYADGVRLEFSSGETIQATGNAEALRRWMPKFRKHKAAIVKHLWTEDLLEYFNERAAILEFSAGLSRAEAEEQARRATALLARNRGAPWCALRDALGDQSLPDTNEPVDCLPYSLPTWCVLPNGKPIRQGLFDST